MIRCKPAYFIVWFGFIKLLFLKLQFKISLKKIQVLFGTFRDISIHILKENINMVFKS